MRLEEGPDQGSTVPLELSEAVGPVDLEVGDGLILEGPPASAPDAPYGLYDRVRTPALLWLAILFAGLVIVLGRLKGLGALAGLGVSLLLLVWFALPAVLHGSSPLLVAAVTAGATAYVVIFLAHGFGELTDVALLGTLGGVALALLLGALWVPFAELTGLASEGASVVRVLGLDVDPRGSPAGRYRDRSARGHRRRGGDAGIRGPRAARLGRDALATSCSPPGCAWDATTWGPS